MKKINFPEVKPNQDELEKDIEGEAEEFNEERLVGPQDEGDDDPYDTTPSEAEEQADEGGTILEEERRRKNHPDNWD